MTLSLTELSHVLMTFDFPKEERVIWYKSRYFYKWHIREGFGHFSITQEVIFHPWNCNQFSISDCHSPWLKRVPVGRNQAKECIHFGSRMETDQARNCKYFPKFQPIPINMNSLLCYIVMSFTIYLVLETYPQEKKTRGTHPAGYGLP